MQKEYRSRKQHIRKLPRTLRLPAPAAAAAASAPPRCRCHGASARKLLLPLHQRALPPPHHRMLPPAMDLTVAGPALVSSGEPR